MRLPHPAVQIASCKQFFLCATCLHMAFVNQNDLIRGSDRGQPVGNHEKSSALHQPGHALLDQSFILGIGISCRFIENNHRSVFQHCSGNRDPLSLAAGQMAAGAAAIGLISVFQSQDKRMAAAGFRCFHYFLVGSFRITETDILHNAHIEQIVVLRDIGDHLLVIVQRNLPDIHAAKRDAAAAHVPEGRDQLGDG